MKTVTLAPYSDENGNRIEFTGTPTESIHITFRGKNNLARIHSEAKASKLRIDFNGNNGTFLLGSNRHKRTFSGNVRVGQDAEVRIGDEVSATSSVLISAVEGVSVDIGDDVMFASRNEVRADDGHPIFDVRTGKRVNDAQSIKIGQHTWIGAGAIILAGTKIGQGSVIGIGSIVTRDIPNNSIAVGSPAQVVRTDIAWERPHLGLVRPFYKPDASTVEKSPYWHLTADDDTVPKVAPAAASGSQKLSVPRAAATRRLRQAARRGRTAWRRRPFR
ncbi:acyltransferase [Flexivirga alba]|uniref:Acyltransferase n=1 Tax=Flexivirga alba TaxID=702742 RepID=A0ABW2AF82_9MICO